MRYIFTLIAIIFLSCSRNGSLVNGNAEVSFDINGKHYQHPGQIIKTNGNLAYPTHYVINGFTSSSNNIVLWINTDSLKTISYHLTAGLNGIMADGNQNIFYESSDFIDVVISQYSNATVTGTFTGKISQVVSLNPYTVKPATITNGQINNVKVIYQ